MASVRGEAKSGRAVEAAGDIDVLLLDKTGTITIGDRQASEFRSVGASATAHSPKRRCSPACRRNARRADLECSCASRSRRRQCADQRHAGEIPAPAEQHQRSIGGRAHDLRGRGSGAFDTEELLARLRVALRHRYVEPPPKAIRAAGLTIDPDTRIVRRDDVELHLRRKEHDVLAILARHIGRVVTHDRIIAAAWGGDDDPRVEYLRIVIRNLRQKLEFPRPVGSVIANEPASDTACGAMAEPRNVDATERVDLSGLVTPTGIEPVLQP